MKKICKLTAILLTLVMLCSMLVACGSGNSDKGAAKLIEDNMDEEVKLVWYIRSSEPQGFKEVLDEANKQLKEKLNVVLDLRCVEPGDYDSKLQLAAASGEEFDIVWTSNWANKFEPNVSKNAFMDITDYLESPDLEYIRNLYKDGVWDACRVGGRIYGVPIEQVIYDQAGIWFMKEYCDKYNINPYEKLKTIEDLEDIYQTVHDGEPGFIMCTQINSVWDKQKSEIGGGWFIDADGNITDMEDWPQHGIDTARRARDWNERGFFPADIATFDEEDSYIKQGKIFSRYGRYLPGSEGKTRISNGFDVYHVPTGDKRITRGSVQSTMSAISFTSKHPMRALKLVQLMHQDEELLNLICYGIEGRDYTKDPENPKRMNRESGGYYISEFLVGSQFLAYLVPSYEDGVWEETKAENEAADVDPLISFSFDRKPVETELSNCSAVAEEFKGLDKGLYEDYETVYAEKQEKLKKAGKDIIREEVERQYNEWKSAQ